MTKPLDLLELKTAIFNTVFWSDDLGPMEALAEIALLLLAGKQGSWPSNSTIGKAIRSTDKDGRTARRVLENLNARWETRYVPGRGNVRTLHSDLEHMITASVTQIRDGKLTLTINKRLPQGAEIEAEKPLPLASQGRGPDPWHVMQGVPLAPHAGGEDLPLASDAGYPWHPTPVTPGTPCPLEREEERKEEREPIADEFANWFPDQEPIVTRTKSYVTVKLPDEKPVKITLQWLKAQRETASEEALLLFAEAECLRFVGERPVTKAGRLMTPFGHLGIAFQYRFDQWLASRTGTAPRRNDDPYKPVKTQSGGWTRQGLLVRPEDMPGLENVKPLARID